jgi:CRP-like cAMP-binding protein
MPHKKLIARLQAVLGVSEHDGAALATMPHQIKTFAPGEYIWHQGDNTARCTIVMSGFLASEKVIAARNQILSIYLPGDIPDLHTLHLPVMEHDLSSIGTSTVASVSHSFLTDTLMKSPALMRAFWRETIIDAAIYRAWVGSLGSLRSLPRLAHLICELAARLEIVGLLKNDSFEFPFRQQNLADACGLSSVHVNRTVQELRQRGLIECEGRVIHLLKRRELEALAEFNPDYLHVGKYADTWA